MFRDGLRRNIGRRRGIDLRRGPVDDVRRLGRFRHVWFSGMLDHAGPDCNDPAAAMLS